VPEEWTTCFSAELAGEILEYELYVTIYAFQKAGDTASLPN